MARVSPSPLIAEITGSIGTVTFHLTQYGLIAKARRMPKIGRRHLGNSATVPASGTGIAASHAFKRTLDLWNTLTPEQKAAWDAYAFSLRPPHLPHSRNLHWGRVWFIKVNATCEKITGHIFGLNPPVALLPTVKTGYLKNVHAVTHSLRLKLNEIPIVPIPQKFWAIVWIKFPRSRGSSTSASGWRGPINLGNPTLNTIFIESVIPWIIEMLQKGQKVTIQLAFYYEPNAFIAPYEQATTITIA
jgi:hypothetical protein